MPNTAQKHVHHNMFPSTWHVRSRPAYCELHGMQFWAEGPGMQAHASHARLCQCCTLASNSRQALRNPQGGSCLHAMWTTCRIHAKPTSHVSRKGNIPAKSDLQQPPCSGCHQNACRSSCTFPERANHGTCSGPHRKRNSILSKSYRPNWLHKAQIHRLHPPYKIRNKKNCSCYLHIYDTACQCWPLMPAGVKDNSLLRFLCRVQFVRPSN